MRLTRRRTRGGAAVSGGAVPASRDLLQWVYVARVTVPIVLFAAAAFNFKAVPRETILILAVAAITGVVVSALSVWYTHIRRVEPGVTFLYVQALFDLAIVTTVVHVTEGPDSQFPALYVLVIAVSAVLMPLASSLLITSLASLLYVADIVWWQPVELSVVIWLQISVFVGVFVATGLIASRVPLIGAEREVLRREVRRLKLEASEILQKIRSGVVTVDGSGRVLFINEAARDLLGLAQGELVGRDLAGAVGDRATELLRAIRDTQTTGRRTLRAEGTVTLDDKTYPIGVTTTALELDDEELPSVTAIFTDISHQKRLEELHLRAERLEAVAELSASLAHEIKNPLASIRSSVEQLAGSPRADDDERFLAQLVVRESDRLSRLLNEFLDFSRVRVTNCRPVNLGAVAEAAVEVVRNHPDCPAETAITLAIEPAEIEGDEDLLHRVVVNLVLNAAQADHEQGRITVEVRLAGATDMPHGAQFDDAALLKVSDEGPGIPPELRGRLFDPFVTGRTGGSGLGLAIVQRAVQAHRGVVFVDSIPGRGTTVSVLLPARGAGEVAA
jgi:two-component system sensor histidine kinase PilS (NtrC family)